MIPLTRRGWLTLAGAGGLYVAAWAFGTRELTVLAIGLGLACAIAVAYARLGARPLELHRVVPGQHVEGRRLKVRLELRSTGGPVARGAVAIDDLGPLGRHVVPLVRSSNGLRAAYDIPDVPRGRYVLGGTTLRLEDPFGLALADLQLDRREVLLVRPQLSDLDGLFSSAGGPGGSARRYLVSRVAGYDLHGVRDYQPGESLRQVHWKTTARRRRLMVKEFEDTPSDEAVVLLDTSAAGLAGQAPDSSFEMAVRAAGSIARHLLGSGIRTALVTLGDVRERRSIASVGDWSSALELLSTVQASGSRRLSVSLAEGRDLDAARIWVVTADLDPLVARRLITLRGARRELSVAWVDRGTWGGDDAGGAAAVSDLARAAVPVARLTRGIDLRSALSAAPLREEARATHA